MAPRLYRLVVLLISLSLLASAGRAGFEVSEFALKGVDSDLIAGVPIDIDHDGDLDFLGFRFAEGAEVGGDGDVEPVAAVPLRNDGGVFRVDKRLARKLKAISVPSSNVAAADFDGDGLKDAFVGDSGVDNDPFPGARNSLAFGTPKGRLVDKSRRFYPDRPEFTHGIAVGDATGNGVPDVYEANVGCGGPTCLPLPPGPALFINDGSGRLSVGDGRLPGPIEDDTELVGGEFQSGVFLDADKDGDQDLVLGWGGGDGRRFTSPPPDNGDTESLLLNDGTGFFDYASAGAMPTRRIGTDASTHHMIAGDIDGDGWPDLALNESPLDPGVPIGLQIVLNRRDGTFRDASNGLPAGVAPDHLRMADLNGDGWPDLLGTVEGPPMILLNRGKAKFKEAQKPFDNSPAATSLTSSGYISYPADFDADGDVDILYLADGQRVFFAENMSPLSPAKKLKKPGKPSLRGPQGDSPFSESALLEWRHKKRAAFYDVLVATDEGFGSIVFEKSDWTGDTLKVTGLDAATTYHWRVRGENLTGAGPWSAPSSFSTAP